MANIISPNMNLIIPGVGTESGPTYANDINSSLTLIDQHNHSSGSGVQINPDGLNINANLSFNDNQATNVAAIQLVSQSSITTNGTIYESGNDLHFVNGAGLDIKITNNSGVAVSPTSIPGLVTPASVEYVPGASTFVWESNTSIAADMDFGSAIMRNLSPNSTYSLTLSPPTLSNNYTLTLPTLPSAKSIMALDTSGNISAPYTVDNSTITINSNVIEVAAGGITSTQIANNTITSSQIANGTITSTQIANSTITSNQIANQTVAVSNLVQTPFVQTPLSGYVSTTSSTPLAVLTATVNNIVPNRPVFISFRAFQSGSGSQEVGFGWSGVNFGIFRILATDPTSAQNVIAQFTLNVSTSSGAAQLFVPASAISAIDTPTMTGTYSYQLVYFSPNNSDRVYVSNVQMTVFQI